MWRNWRPAPRAPYVYERRGRSLKTTPIQASAAIRAPTATVSGVVSVLVTITGGITAPTARPLPPIDVTGTVTAPTATVTGAVSVVVGVTGELTAPTATVAGVILPYTRVTAPTATVSGTGTVTYPPPEPLSYDVDIVAVLDYEVDLVAVAA